MSDLYLVHHGIKGQKWGVRRFQNDDGSLTPAGARRYYSHSGKITYGNGKTGYTARVGLQRVSGHGKNKQYSDSSYADGFGSSRRKAKADALTKLKESEKSRGNLSKKDEKKLDRKIKSAEESTGKKVAKAAAVVGGVAAAAAGAYVISRYLKAKPRLSDLNSTVHREAIARAKNYFGAAYDRDMSYVNDYIKSYEHRNGFSFADVFKYNLDKYQ